jgi:hypothetical protein
MKNNIILAAFAALLIAVAGCKKPTEGLNFNISPEVIKHTIYVKVKDANGNNVNSINATLSIGGESGDYVYEVGGEKDFTMHEGAITLGLDPAKIPMDGSPVKFTVQVTAPGYLPQEEEVEVYPEQLNQQVYVSLINMANPPSGLDMKIQAYRLENGAIKSPGAFVKNKTTADSAYYDDGLTTVVLPAGTTFYYYKYQQTGTRKGVKLPLKMKSDTTFVNGKIKIGSISTPYQDTIDYPVMGYVKTPLTGSDSLVVACIYAPGNDVNLKIYDEGDVQNTPNITTIEGESIRLEELLYRSCVKKRLAQVRFIGYVKEGSQRFAIDVMPEAKSKWFTSYVLDQAAINPVTNAVIQEGDSIEIGVDPYYTKKTLRVPILKSDNGQLRVQAQSVEVGYYFKANYTYTFNYEFDAKNPAKSVIPDAENLQGYAYINLGVEGYSLWFNGGGGKIKMNKKVASKNPITENDASVSIYYCGKFTNTTKVAQGPVSVFPAGSFSNLPAPVSFICKLYCENKKTYINPTAFVSVESDSRLFYCNFIAGKWKTRGVTEGQILSASGWIGGYFLDYGNQEIENPMLLERSIQGNESVCF